MANESDRAGLIGAALGAFFTCILAGIWLRLILGPSKPSLPLPLNQNQNQHEQELEELPSRRNRGLDLERGVVGGEFQLRDPDMFMIPEEDEGGESNSRPTTHHRTSMANSMTGGQHSKKVQAPPKLRLKSFDTVADAYTGDRDNPRPVKENTMSEVIPVLEDDKMLLMHPGVSLSQSGSKRSSQRTSFLSDPFDLSHFLSRRSVSHATKPEGTQVVSDALPAMPKPAVTQKSRGHSIHRRLPLLGQSSNNGPSNADYIPDPSTFEVEDIGMMSKDDPATQWKPAPPEVSRYRGLSATRPDQKPQILSPSQSHIDIDHVAPQITEPLPAIIPPLPAPETFDINTRPDSLENFSSTGDDDTDGDPAEWTSQVCSPVAEPRRAEAFQALHVGADKAPTKADKGLPGGHPDWPYAGPFTPSPRILEQKASLPGRKSKFFEVDIDEVPVGESRELALVRRCVKLLREGARTPTILTSYGEVESPAGEGQDLGHA